MKASGLSKAKLTVLKIGGSVITDKTAEMTARTQEINRLAEEIEKAYVPSLVLVHGGGSFGHPVATRHAIKEGFKEPSQALGFAETHHVMTVLNGLLMDSLVWHNVPAVSITPSSCVMTENGRIKSFSDSSLEELLRMRLLPVLYGDAVLDTKLGFTILSGDQLVTYIATKFNAERIIIGVDVDGLYEADPKTDNSAKMFEHLTLEELSKFQKSFRGSKSCDVTGGMFGKICELAPAVEKGIPATILNATKPDYVYKALKREKVQGTVIEKG
jgi:isopentenyl phosphate kinase